MKAKLLYKPTKDECNSAQHPQRTKIDYTTMAVDSVISELNETGFKTVKGISKHSH